MKRVMIIDDSEVYRFLVRINLAEAGYDVIEGNDGQDALTKLKQAQVNLIICDLNMPEMDGLTFVKWVKQMPAHKFTPIIMLTTESDAELQKRGQEVGVRIWMVKPFTKEHLLETVSKLLM